MMAELGHYALALALGVALIQAIVPMVGAARGDRRWMAVAPSAALTQFGLLLFAFLALMQAYVTSDFSVLNVAANSHSLKPMLYKISGVWGNHEGSLLLWVSVMALFGSLVAVFGRNLPPGLKARTLAIQGLIASGFLLFMLFTSNPFDRLFPAPLEGNDLNPLLQDPGLAFHPPMLYVGYVGLSIVFSFACAALIEGKVDAAWARWVRPWTLLAWAFLTAGIALGSWWAYYELGWGGFWYWDPVENASFMPWLVATALLHSAIVVEKRDTLKSWTILLAIIGFSLSLIGTFLVRSGVLTSVHAFASDPERGVFILLLLCVSIGGSFALYAWRAPSLAGGGLFRPISREGALVLNNLLLTTASATVLLGTLYPLLLEIVTGDKISVGPPFFNATFVPIMVPLFVALGVGPFLPWKRADLSPVLRLLTVAFVFAVAVTAAAALVVWGKAAYALIGIAVAAWLAAATVTEIIRKAKPTASVTWGQAVRRLGNLPRAAWGMSAAHLGVAVVVAGATGASLLTEERIEAVRIGETVPVAGFEFVLTDVHTAPGPNYEATQGVFHVAPTGLTLVAENRKFFSNGQVTTEAAIESTLWYDLYAVLGDPAGDGRYTVRLYFKPLVPWLWIGSTLMVLGGFLSLSDRRLRVGAPRRSAAPAQAQPAE
ncbi:heme lyase CcmF/NrfE family subunit [Rhodospirillaceae bacterium KN72]|uniref:Heme lyase CcmF/NrfE family subunit n=1 Tax=Pacificispira spongiicola TaxID=2729598 RepID=A0A7Y0E0F9_9PROT|nr:heme lyase CcmF/NrfE family subunit [Pacificispira spongiicola]NMM44950.1 heme lyase CcmF/NrfE family subunit [Pacificispira spongiicola]